MALQWRFLLLLPPLLAAQNYAKPYPNNYGKPQEGERCYKPQWDSRLRFTPDQWSYRLNEEVTVRCFMNIPPLATIRCTNRISTGWKNAWEAKDIWGTWHMLTESLNCTMAQKCSKPQWDVRLKFPGNKNKYQQNKELTLTCPEGLQLSFPKVKCTKEVQEVSSGKPLYEDVWWVKNSTGAWMHIERDIVCTEICQKPPWDSRLQLAPNQENYEKDEKVMLSCPEGFQPSFTEIKCESEVQYDSYGTHEYRLLWKAKDIHDDWIQISEVKCIEICQRPRWDSRLQLAPDQENYKKNQQVILSCPGGFQPRFTHVKCGSQVQSFTNGKPVYREVWTGKDSRGIWVNIPFGVECIEAIQVDHETFEISCTSIKLNWTCRFPDACQGMRAKCQLAVPSSPSYEAEEVNVEEILHGQEGTFTCSPLQPSTEYSVTIELPPSTTLFSWLLRTKEPEICQKPPWDSRLQLAPNQENYEKDEKVMLSCPEGFQPSFTEIKCESEVQYDSYGTHEYRLLWKAKDIHDDWIQISEVKCIEAIQIDPETFEISSTSIKLNWTCRFPDACQGMRAKCQLAVPSSPSCEAEEVKIEEILHGQEGTFTCSPLQPFTEYVVIFDSPHSTVIYRKRERTKETVPDKLEKLWLDPDRGSLRWKALPPCKGEIIGYELSITARNAGDSSMLEHTRLWLNGSVTEYRLAEHSPGTSYAVTMQAQTAAGDGPALVREFQLSSSDTAQPPGIRCRSVRDISPSQGTAVLPLRPIALPSEGSMEHGLLVVPTHNTSVIESICSVQPQFLNTSIYRAAIFNLTAPTDFVLGDGSRGREYNNAALHPGWDYTALLVRSSSQLQKVICVCYSFSLGQEPSSLLDRKPVVIAVALTVAFLALGILLLFVLFRLKRNNSKASENDSTIPLRGCQKDVCKPNTQIPVEELLETLKMFKREEMEADQTDDESVDRHDAGLLKEYQQLSSTLLHPCQTGRELCNQSKNRYKSIIPYDHCRVVLQPSDTGNGYINASYVDSYRSPHFFIAAQGPLAGTVVDFWQMVWQEKTSVVVMLTGLVEQNKIKCEQYWPEQEQVYGDFTVTLNNTWATTGLVKRIFCLQKAGCALPRAVEQFHYLLWPDHGVPRNPSQLLCLVEVVNKRVLESPAGPVLVHCSAGIGRTGTFIALDFLLKMGKAEGKVDVFHCVQQLREQRVSMVQTKEQYNFLYEALLEGLLCGNTGVPVESIATLVHSLREDETSGHNSVLEKEFKALQRFSELFQLLPCREAGKPRNQPKNRKPGILPADSCRPILMSSVNADGSPAYINAVFATTYTEEERIIITQLPFPTTLVDFWALVWDYTCTSVVVLNQLHELDKTYVQFWPTQGEDDYGRFHVELISEEPGAGFTTWTLVLTNRQQPKKSAVGIQLHQLTDWPMQQHLPPHPDTIISLLGKVETHHRQSQDGHILVTCWDGASRSGIFCAAGFLCEQIQSEGVVDVSQAVRMLKRRRRQFIKDMEQYRLCYELALSYLNSFETYGNFK